MDPVTIIGGLAALGVGLWSSNQQSKQQQKMYDAQMRSLQQINTQAQAEMPQAPNAPTEPTIDAGAAQNAAAEEARKEALRQSAANNAMVNPTGGLGVTGDANIGTAGGKRRSLGGI